MKKIYLAVLVFATVMLMGLPSHAQNLLTNADFESASQDPWWGPWGTSQHAGFYGDAGTGIGGSKSVKFTPVSLAGTGDDYFMYNNNLVAVTPGTTYYGAISAKTLSLVNEEVFIKIDWFNSSGGWVGTAGASPTLTGTQDWTTLQISGAAPANATRASLAFFINQTVDGGTGTAYYDNAYLGVTPVPEPSSIALLAMGGVALVGVVRRKMKK